MSIYQSYESFYDDWRAVDTQGELHVLIHLSRLNMPSPQALNMKLPKIRVHLERLVYYPGDVVRGCVVLSTTRTQLRLIVEGATRSGTSKGAGEYIYFGSETLILGERGADKTEKGAFKMFPFEFTLPLTLPHSYDSGKDLRTRRRKPHEIGPEVNVYRVIADTTMFGSFLTASTEFRVLAHPMHATLESSWITLKTSMKPASVAVDVDGPPVAWCGEFFSLNVKIQNKSHSPICHLLVRLKAANWNNGRFIKSWNRTGGKWRKVNDSKIADLPGFPIAPDQAWNGTIQFPIPSDLNPTMHPTISPLLQNGYHLVVKPVTSGDKVLPACGNKKHVITVSDHYSAFDHLEVPVDVSGEVGVITTAPAPSDMNSRLAPLPQTKPGVLEYIGGTFGSIAAYSGAGKPKQSPHLQIYLSPELRVFYLTDDEWTPGREPSWFGSSSKGS